MNIDEDRQIIDADRREYAKKHRRSTIINDKSTQIATNACHGEESTQIDENSRKINGNRLKYANNQRKSATLSEKSSEIDENTREIDKNR